MLRELADVAWRDAIAASDEGRLEDAGHAMALFLELDQEAMRIELQLFSGVPFIRA